MWKLRQTWNEIFPPKKMFSLDVRVHSIDPAWPIIALPSSISSVSPGSIHVNPRFLSLVRRADFNLTKKLVFFNNNSHQV